MRKQLRQEIAYIPKTSELLSLFDAKSHAVCLGCDQTNSNSEDNWSVISATPNAHVYLRSTEQAHTLELTYIERDKVTQRQQICTNNINLANIVAPLNSTTIIPPETQQNRFCLGLIGAASYEFGEVIHGIRRTRPEGQLLFFAGYYSWSIVSDHNTQQSFIYYYKQADLDYANRIIASYQPLTEPQAIPATEFTQLTNPKRYLDSIKAIKHYLVNGDCYQVNYTHQHSAPVSCSGAAAYQALNSTLAAPYSAYININGLELCSFSPEQFISVRDGDIQTKPIKGTRKRHSNPVADLALIDELKASAKDQAENVMIVDLLRNDLSIHAEADSVIVKNLCAVESFSHVHHLVSTVTATAKNNIPALAIFNDAFPGGSITGAPKHRSMEIIAELEDQPRGFYCGSIFYQDDAGGFDSNILIRTLIIEDGQAHCHGGGGIVNDSVPQDEHQESLDKIEPILALFRD